MFETLTLDKFESFHHYQEEMANRIMHRENNKGQNGKNYETTHKYIDFSYTIIGEKIKNINNKPKELRFDDIYYSRYMLRAAKGEKFYLSESIQKIIDFQW